MTADVIFVQRTMRPPSTVLVKRGRDATDCFDYCKEVGCDIWGLLLSMESDGNEPVGMWLPTVLRRPGTSEYVQGIEVSVERARHAPTGLDMIELPACEYLRFQGEPFAEEDYAQAVCQVRAAIDKYVPETIGYQWDDTNPIIQLEPRGRRGYIELRPVRLL